MSGKGSSKLHEKHQLILANMLREEDNKFCADCLAKGPRWASWNIGVFLCIRCAGIHRNLGVHISRVKSVNLDSWTPEQIETIQRGGNAIAKEKYEANLPSSFRRPQDDYSVEQLIRNKYERKLFISKESPVVSKATEAKSSPSSTRVKGSKKQSSNQNKDQMLAVPRPSTQTKRSTTPSPSPPPTTSTPSPATHSTPTPNLIAMETAAPVAKQETVDLLTGLETATQGTSPQQPSPQQPSIGEDPQKAVKDNILSLYQTPQQHGYQAYTAHGYPVNPYHYQQQQLAAMRMAQQQQQQHMAITQVREVEQQMRGLKVQQNPLTNGQPPLQPQFTATPSNTPFPQSGGGGGEWGGGGGEGGGGQTLNPQLW